MKKLKRIFRKRPQDRPPVAGNGSSHEQAVLRWFQTKAIRHGLGLAGFAVSIEAGEKVAANLLHRAELVEELPVKDLVAAFAGSFAASLPGIGILVSSKVRGFLVRLSNELDVGLHELAVRIVPRGKGVEVFVVVRGEVKRGVALEELLSFFG